MRNRISKFANYFVMLICVGILISCGSDDGGGSTQPPVELNFTAKVNGETWAAVSATGNYHFLCNTLMIEGSASDGSKIQLFYDGVAAPQSYPLTAESISYMNYIKPGGEVYTSSATTTPNAGSLVLLEFDGETEKATGKFGGGAFVSGVQPIIIGDGSFTDMSFTTNLTDLDCPDDDPNDDPDEDPEYPEVMISYFRDGVYHETDALITDQNSNEYRVEHLYGANGNHIRITFDRDAEPGTYSAMGSDGFSVNADIGFVIYYNVSGSVELLVHDMEAKFVQGTFELETEKSGQEATPASFTDGKFAIYY